MRLFISSIKLIPTIGFVFMIVLFVQTATHAQAASSLVKRAETAYRNEKFDAAIADLGKAIAINKKLLPAYQLRAKARLRKAEVLQTGYASAADRAEWQKIFEDYVMAIALTDQDKEAYETLSTFVVEVPNNESDDVPSLFAEFDDKLEKILKDQIAANPRNVCAYAYLGEVYAMPANLEMYLLGVEKFDGIHGRLCSAFAARGAAGLMPEADGDREVNKKEAKRLYQIAFKRNPDYLDTSIPDFATDEAIDKAFSDVEKKRALAAKAAATPAPTPQPVSTPVPKPSNSMASASTRNVEPQRPAWMDEFERDFSNFSDAFALLADEYARQTAKIERGLREDAKYGVNTQSWFSGTRAKAQTQLNAMHKLFRSFLAKWGNVHPNSITEQIRKMENSYPDKVP